MRILSNLSNIDIMEFDGVIITQKDLVKYDPELDLNDLLSYPESYYSTLISIIDSNTKLVSFESMSRKYWRIKSIVLYKGDLNDPTVLAVLNEDSEQIIETFKFNFRIHIDYSKGLATRYNGILLNEDYIEETNDLVKPFNIDHSDFIKYQKEAIDLNNNQLVSPGITIDSGFKYIDVITKLKLVEGLVFNSIIPLIVEGVPFITGLISNLSHSKGSYYSIDLTRKIIYFSSEDLPYNLFKEKYIKDYTVVITNTKNSLVYGATLIHERGSYTYIKDLLRGSSEYHPTKDLEFLNFGFPTSNENTDFSYCTKENWVNLIGVPYTEFFPYISKSAPQRFFNLSRDIYKIRYLIKDKGVFLNFKSDPDEYPMIISNRNSNKLTVPPAGSQSDMCLISSDEFLISHLKLKSDNKYYWYKLTSDNFNKWSSDTDIIISIFGTHFLFENKNCLTRINV